jgi:hypothetical protein
MRVTARVLQLAIIDVLTACGSGTRVSVDTLEMAWMGTGLRRADLVDGLLRLAAVGAVRIEATREGIYVVIDDDARARVHHPMRDLRDLLATARARLILARTRLRRPSPAPSGERRSQQLN